MATIEAPKSQTRRSRRQKPAAFGVTPDGVNCLIRGPEPTGPDVWFDPAAADHACDFFASHLTHSRGREWAGKAFVLEPWQAELIVRPLFGWRLRPAGDRRVPRSEWPRLYRRAYLKLPKGNGKSPLAAGLALLLAFDDGEPGADVYCLATKEEQADIVHGEARKMVKRSPVMSSLLQVYAKSIVREETMQGFQRLTSEGAGQDGLNWHGLIVDELHELADRKLYETVSNANKLSRQPLEVMITTSGVPAENPVYAEIDQQAHDVAAGTVHDPRLLVVMFEAPETADWHDPEVWKAANPNYGVSVRPEYLEEEHRKACLNPARESAFRRYNLNQNVSRKDGWMAVDLWDRCDKPLIPAELRGRRCWVGGDLSSKKDLTALVAAFQFGEDVAWLCHAFTPDEGIEEKEKKDRAAYREWAQRGFMTLVPGRVVRKEHVKAKLIEWAGVFDLAGFAYDPWSAGELVEDLTAEGIECKEFRQGFRSMSPAMKKVEELTLARLIIHGANPLLRWCFGNVRVDMDPAGNIKPNKRRSTSRIDPIVAGIMATAALLENPDVPSVYEDRGIVML